jgi:hypothetical protein
MCQNLQEKSIDEQDQNFPVTPGYTKVVGFGGGSPKSNSLRNSLEDVVFGTVRWNNFLLKCMLFISGNSAYSNS